MPTQVQYEYLSRLLGIDLSARAAPPGGDADAPGGPGGPAAETAAKDGPPPAATDTDLFFAKGSAALTPDDTGALDKYAAAMAAGSDAITIQGFASVDGDPAANAKLATDRANAVQKYLAGKGIAASRLSAKGQGPTTQFGKGDLPANRRAVLAPKPPAKAPPADAPLNDGYDPLPPDSPPAQPGVPPIPRLTPEQLQKIIGDDKGEPRDKVQKELTDFFEKLMKDQGLKSGVKITKQVWQVGVTLGKGTKNEHAIDAMLSGDPIGKAPADLAKQIADMLPDFIPRENYTAFQKMKPQELKGPEKFSIAGAIAKVFTPVVKKATSFLPKPIQEKIEKGVEDAIVKGITSIADKAMEGSGLDDDTKKAIHNAVEAAIKEKGDGSGKDQ